MKQFVDELLVFLSPVANALDSPENLERLLGELGFAPSLADVQGVAPGFQPILDELENLIAAAEELSALPGELSFRDPAWAAFVQAAAALIARLRDIPELLAAFIPDDFLVDLLDLLVVEYLNVRQPALSRFLVLLDVVQVSFVPAAGDPLSRGADYTRVHIEWPTLGDFFGSPRDWAESTYGWGTPEFDHARFLHRLARVFDALGRVAFAEPVSDNYLSTFLASHLTGPDRPVATRLPLWRSSASDPVPLEVGLQIAPVDPASPGDLDDIGLGVMPYATGAADGTRALDARWDLIFKGAAEIAGGVVVALRPQSGFAAEGGVEAGAPADAEEWLLQLRFKKDPAKPFLLLFGDEDGTRLQADTLVVGAGGANEDFYVAGGFEALKLVIDLSDNELLSLLIPEPITATAGDLIAGWRPGRGIYFENGAGLEIFVPLAVEIGSGAIRARVHGVGVKLGFAPETSLGLTVDFDLTLGPLTLGTQGLGLALALLPADSGDGRFGRFDVRAGPLFPTGYMVGLDAGPIAGGGALIIQEDGFGGALALRFGSFGISAFALMTTRLPSGAQGFSFLATLFVEFEVQLGYGFKLTGLGGLIGLNRTCNVEQLRTLLLAGNLDSLLFPEDPVSDALLILNGLAVVYPPAEGQDLVGPAVKIAWGTPTLIEGKLAVIFEFGGFVRVLILGSVGTALPTKEAAILVLRVDFVGVIDFDRGSVAFDATLAASRLLDWPLSGEMALRTGWGPGAGLVAAVGGLHPQFPVPSGFPSLQRITVNFGTNNPKLTLQGYLAVTLATVQAGARASLYFKGPDIFLVGQLEVEGQAWFDALVHFDPFHFETELGLSIHLLIDGDTICGIGGDLRLSGPNVYHLKGRAWVDVCGLDLSIGVDETWGDAVAELAQTVDALAVLRDELAKGAWEVVPPRARISGVRFEEEEPSPGAPAALDPSGGLRVQQRALPLGLRLTRIGTARLATDTNTLDLALLSSGGNTVAARDYEVDFVRAHFFDLDDDEKLRGPAMEPLKGGVSVHGPEELIYDPGSGELVDCDYETIFLGDEPLLMPVAGTPLRVPDAWEISSMRNRSKPLRNDFVTPALMTRQVQVVRSEPVIVSVDGRVRRAERAGLIAREELRAGRQPGERWLAGYLAVG